MAAAVSWPNSASSVDPERDADVVAGELDVLDLADPDAGDPDLVVGLEAAGLAEGGVVDVATADDRGEAGLEGRQEQRRRGRRG